MNVAWAVSNPADNFVKAHGRNIAVARLAKKPVTCPYDKNKPIEDMIAAAMSSPTFPDSARRLVEKHIKAHPMTNRKVANPNPPDSV